MKVKPPSWAPILMLVNGSNDANIARLGKDFCGPPELCTNRATEEMGASLVDSGRNMGISSKSKTIVSSLKRK